MVAHMFLDQPANLRYRTDLFGIGLGIRLALVLSKLNVKCYKRRFSCWSKREAGVYNKAIVFKWVFYTDHMCVCHCVFMYPLSLYSQVPVWVSS